MAQRKLATIWWTKTRMGWQLETSPEHAAVVQDVAAE
jgi:hypothetical protein